MREAGDGIDWYAARSGEVRRLVELGDSERAAALETVETQLSRHPRFGGELKASTGSDEAQLIGRSLRARDQPAVRRLHLLVDGQPVIAAWGYEADATQAWRLSRRRRCRPVPPPPAPAAVLASAPAALLPAPGSPGRRWLSALLFGLMLLLLLLITSWLLRACAPVDPSLNVATWRRRRRPPPRRHPIRRRSSKASLNDVQADEAKLKAELAALEGDIKDKVAQCKPRNRPSHRRRSAAEAPPPPASTAAATAGRRPPGATRTADQPAAAGPAAVQLVGQFWWRRRDKEPTLSW